MAYLTDIAGVRVICYYIQDVYVIAGILKNQPDTVLIKETDYIKNPKPNGYRSYHMVLGITLHQVKRGQAVFPCGDPDPHAGDGFLGQYGTSALL